MAKSTDISFVIDCIDRDYEEHGWEETDIVDRLDAGAIPQRVVAAYWRMRANVAIDLVNTSESGSSRGLDSVYPRLSALAESWETRAELLESPPEQKDTARLSTFSIKRV